MLYLTPQDTPMVLDATGATVTEPIAVGSALVAVVQAQAVAGAAWSSAVLTVKVSLTGDPSQFYGFPDAVTLSADGMTPILDVSGYAYMQVAVSTTDAGAPKINLWVGTA